MAYSVFLIPSVTKDDQPSLWQLQLLAESHGFVVSSAARTKHTDISASVSAAIRDCDAAILIATKALSEHAAAELQWALKLKKPVLALVEQTLSPRLTIPTLTFRRGEDISRAARQLMSYVKDVTSGKVANGRRPPASSEAQSALGWLLGIGLALIALSALSREE